MTLHGPARLLPVLPISTAHYPLRTAGDCRPLPLERKDDICFARRVAGGTCEAVRRSVSVAFCGPSEFAFCARGLPGCAGTAMPLRRNGDAVAPERRCRCAGTVMPLRRNGDAVAPERPPRSTGTAARCGKDAAVSPRSLSLSSAKAGHPLAYVRGVNVSPADPLDGCAASRTDEIPVPMRKNSPGHENGAPAEGELPVSLSFPSKSSPKPVGIS